MHITIERLERNVNKITTYADLVARVEHLTEVAALQTAILREKARVREAEAETTRLKAVSAAIQHDINRATMRMEAHV